MKSPRYQPQPKKWLAWIISMAALAAIIWQVQAHEAITQHSLEGAAFFPMHGAFLALVIFLIPLNWGIEAIKWHVLLGRKARPFQHAYREVLIGSTWGFLTPNRSGDVAARVALLSTDQRATGLRAFGWSAWAQGGMTLTFGALSLVSLSAGMNADSTMVSLGGIRQLQSAWGFDRFWIVPALAIAGALTWWGLGWSNATFGSVISSRMNQKFKWPNWMASMEHGTPHKMRSQVPLIIALSALRYAVFATQFLMALYAYGFSEVLDLLPTIALVYWGNMIIPTAALAEMGVREALIILLLQPSAEMTIPLISATFVVWALNLVVPAIIGAFISPSAWKVASSRNSGHD